MRHHISTFTFLHTGLRIGLRIKLVSSWSLNGNEVFNLWTNNLICKYTYPKDGRDYPPNASSQPLSNKFCIFLAAVVFRILDLVEGNKSQDVDSYNRIGVWPRTGRVRFSSRRQFP